jgi:hypothetical protein
MAMYGLRVDKSASQLDMRGSLIDSRQEVYSVNTWLSVALYSGDRYMDESDL